MNVILLHPSLNQRGGAEKVLIRMIDALAEAGHNVTLYTIDKTDWASIEENWGIRHRPVELWHLKNRRYLDLPLAKWPIILTLYISLLTRAAKKRHHVSLNNYGEALPLFTDAAYIHSMPLASSTGNPYGFPLWHMLKPIYKALLSIFRGYYPSLILTNSHYNAGNIKTSYRRVLVLPPPVDHAEAPPTPKTPSILTASRPSKAKNLETIPQIAEQITTECSFHICLTMNPGDEATIQRLHGSHITIHRNPPKAQLEHLRQTSTIYLSTQPTEAFGLSILEAMDAGCIPVVPRGGGPWHDILDEKQGEAGYAYDTPSEAAKHIDDIITDKALAECLRQAARNRAKHYPGPPFSTTLIRLLAEIQTKKRGNL